MTSEMSRRRDRPGAALVTVAAVAGLALGFGIYTDWQGGSDDEAAALAEIAPDLEIDGRRVVDLAAAFCTP